MEEITATINSTQEKVGLRNVLHIIAPNDNNNDNNKKIEF